MLDNDLPVHPFTGLRALSVLKSGRIVWPVLGGSTPPDPPADPPVDPPADPPADPALGDAGKRAIEKERAARKAAEQAKKEAEAALKVYTDRDATDAEKSAAKQKEADDRIAALTTRAVSAEIRALATGFADPADAAAFLDSAKYVGDDGEIDTEKIKTDLADLLTRKPHLAARRGPKPDPSQGAKPGGTDPPTLAQQIAAAEKSGNLQLAISLKNQQLLALPK